ncbi:mediator complex, subunit Med10 [Globomyces pollinis-pini]|nr:mediator complex, subunit Med10 [Globomyces pollinis-pini]
MTSVLYKAGVTVSDYQENSDKVLQARIQTLVETLKSLDELKDTVKKDIPMNMIEVVENGINPALLRKDQIQTLVDKNQKTNGRIQSLKLLKSELESQIEVNYPDLAPHLKGL